MKTTITIRFIEHVESQAGKMYWKITDTNQNIYSCFEDDIANELKPAKSYEVDIQTSKDGKYKNIRNLFGGDESNNVKTERVESSNYGKQHNISESNNQNRNKSIIAQCLVKAACQSGDKIEDVVKAYKLALSLL